MSAPIYKECKVCFTMIRASSEEEHEGWHDLLSRSLERGGLVQ